MSNVLNRTTKEYLYSVNTPDYPVELWVINPDLSSVQNIPKKYWKIEGDIVSEMNTSEKEAVDAALLPDAKINKKQELFDAGSALKSNQGYVDNVRDSLLSLYSDGNRIRPNRSLHVQQYVDWESLVDTEIKTKQSLVDAQTSLDGVNNITIDSSTLIALDPQVTVNNALEVTDTTSLSLFLNENAVVVDARTGISGPFYLMQELVMRKDLYNDTENPIHDPILTPILGSNGILQDHADRINNVELIHGKLGWHNQQVLQALNRRPKDVLFYYGWPNSFNSATNGWDNEKVAQNMARYHLVVLGNGVADPAHGDYANTQIIIPRIKALNPAALIFGYVSVNQTLANFKTGVDQWVTLGVHGIFMDEAGYDFGKLRSEFNECVDYVHAASKVCFANAWNTDHILGVAEDLSYPNSIYNIDNNPSNLNTDDWILLESFPINTTSYSGSDGYESKSDWAVRGSKIIGLRYTYGVNFASVGIINNDNVNGSKLFNFQFTSAVMFSLEANGTSDTNYGASSAAVTYWDRPILNDIYYTLSPTILPDSGDADVYLRFTDFTKYLLDFSSGAQLSSITVFQASYQGLTGLQGSQGVTGIQGLTGIQGTTGLQGSTGLSLSIFESNQRILMSSLAPGNAGFLLISGTAYFVYLGKVITAFTPKYVEFYVSTGGSGSQIAEVGFFSTTSAPNKANQSISKIVSTGTVDALNSTGVKRNTNAFNTSVSAGTHLWAGIRAAMGTTQPTIWGIGLDLAQGQVLSTDASGALTEAGPWTGAIIIASTSMICPDLRGTLD